MALLYLVTVILLIVAGNVGKPEKDFFTIQVFACTKLI